MKPPLPLIGIKRPNSTPLAEGRTALQMGLVAVWEITDDGSDSWANRDLTPSDEVDFDASGATLNGGTLSRHVQRFDKLGSTGFAFEGWFDPSGTDTEILFTQGGISIKALWEDPVWRFVFRMGDDVAAKSKTGDPGSHHCALVWSSGSMLAYLDGVAVSSAALESPSVSDSDFEIGPMQGTALMACLWHRPLTSLEVAARYNSGTPVSPV